MTRNKLQIFSILFSLFYWMLAGFYFVTIRYMGRGQYAPPDLNYINLALYAGIVGASIGLLFGLFPLSSIIGSQTRRSFLKVVSIGTITYILFFTTVIFLASLFGNSIDFALHYVSSPEGIITLFHLSLCSLIYHFILQINKRFGPGVLLEYTFGKYFSPKEEQRTFMFLDLKSSTWLAETLEHVSYSRLIQDCYAELTTPLVDHKAQVYQYVGDEVVVSWKMNPKFSASLCVRFFYVFQHRLAKKKEYFLQTYGAFPQFKAGAHCGTVTVAEVGELKTEIAYHGDVVNTASRIQSLCNQFNKQLLVSEALVNRLPEQDRKFTAFVVETGLRGKETATKVYSVSDPGGMSTK